MGRSFYNYVDSIRTVFETAPDVLEETYTLITLRTKDEVIRRVYKNSVKSSLSDFGEQFFGDDFDEVFRDE